MHYIIIIPDIKVMLYVVHIYCTPISVSPNVSALKCLKGACPKHTRATRTGPKYAPEPPTDMYTIYYITYNKDGKQQKQKKN